MFRRRSMTLLAPNFVGNILILLLLFLSLSMRMVVAQSFSQLPDGNGESGYGAARTVGTLGRIVDDWLDTNKRPGIEATYGALGEWDVSSVTNFKWLFLNKPTFNTDISKWNVAAAKNMYASKCQPLKIIFLACGVRICDSSTF